MLLLGSSLRPSVTCLSDDRPIPSVDCCSTFPHYLNNLCDPAPRVFTRKGDVAHLCDFPVKHCCVARFASGGHMFAAVGRSNVVGLYSTYSCALLGQMRAHSSAVTDLSFSADDRMLVSGEAALLDWGPV